MTTGAPVDGQGRTTNAPSSPCLDRDARLVRGGVTCHRWAAAARSIYLILYLRQSSLREIRRILRLFLDANTHRWELSWCSNNDPQIQLANVTTIEQRKAADAAARVDLVVLARVC